MTPAEQLAVQASQWQTAGRIDMAVPLYAAAVDQDPSNVALRWHLAECLAYLQQPDQAAVHYLQAAHANAMVGRQHDCLAICERILQVAPHAFSYAAVGPMVRRIGRDARTVCARAAEAHLRAGRQAEGLQILRLGTELDADGPEVRLQLARIYKSRNMTREAVEAMADAGDLLLRDHRVRDYAKVAELLLTLDPDHLDTLRELPQAYLELGRPHDAVRLLSQLTRVSPGDIVGYEILARAFALIGHSDKSLVVLERLIDELCTLGRGDKGDAILERARGWRPNDLGFGRALRRMEIPKPAAARPPAPRAMPPEGTVVLNIADLISNQASRESPGANDGIELTQVEGTLTLRLGQHERQQLAQAPSEATAVLDPHAPLPPSLVPIPGPDDIDASLSMDASELIAALANDLPWEAIADLAIDEDEDDIGEDDIGEDDIGEGDDDADDDADDEPATQLDMKALTAKDIARAQPAASAPVAALPPPPPAFVSAPPAENGDGEDAPTMMHMAALTPADIARALARSSGPAVAPRPSNVPPPPPPPRRSKGPPPPPPPRSPRAPVDADEAMTLAKMNALTPEDIARARRKKHDHG